MSEALQNLTLLEISIIVLFLVGLIRGVQELKKSIKESIQKLLEDQFSGVNKKLDAMQTSIHALDVQATKNFLVRYLADIERGNIVYDSEKQRFWEAYDHYINDLKENSFIKEWVARLKEEGKLKR